MSILLVKVEVTADSHPFYTGKKIFVDTAGRVEKFNRALQEEIEHSQILF
jgi:large subunit ribosomal protein L31